MGIGSIDMLFTQGNIETTGVNTDLAIQGNAFFVVSDGAKDLYTRAGNFTFDGNGKLVTETTGYAVQGRLATNGVLGGPLGDIVMPTGQKSPPSATSTVGLVGNLDATAAPGDVNQTSITIFDEQGTQHDLTVEFSKGANPGEWDYTITVTGADPAGSLVNDTGTITFNQDGSLQGPEAVDFEFEPLGFSTNQTVTVNFGTADDFDGLSQYGSATTAVISSQDGYTMGLLERLSIDTTGTIVGAFTNGTTLTMAQVVLADFNNPGGLLHQGDNVFSESPNSGIGVLGFAGEGSQSVVASGALEMSNVDLAREFTDLITTQRGFQSNARVITTSDEMLQELVSLKR